MREEIGKMLEFKTEKLTDRVTRIFAPSGELVYLVEGDDRAALLDTGSGFGSLKQCIRQLTDKEVIVLITHGHVDHAMGAQEFDTVYMNHTDDYIYQEHAKTDFRRADFKKLKNAKEEEFIPSAPLSHFRDLKGGDSFDLGGITIEIYECPGHTKGSVVMLLREERSLLLGDACNNFTFMFESYSTTITEYKESLKKLLTEVEGTYDTVYLSHGDGNGHKEMIQDLIHVCEDILKGDTDDVPFTFKGNTGLIAKAVGSHMQRRDGQKGNIVYNKNRIK
jgi:glyoxylase-like metal-dependent hydrolase (beta-lactamase superfamily II)